MEVKRVLTIAGSDSGGGAGIQADLKTITLMGGFGMSVVTALTVQNTLGVQSILEVPVDFVEQQLDSVMTDIGIDSAKTGMLATLKILRLVAGKVRDYGIENLVVDPVMTAKGEVPLVTDEARDAISGELIPLARVVTPNIPEAEIITGISINSVDDMKKAAQIIRNLGAEYVVVKGGHLGEAQHGSDEQSEAVDVLYDGREFRLYTSERINTSDTHGTGCTYSAAIATSLAFGKSVYDAVALAKEYITRAIRHSHRIGKGHGPVNHHAMTKH